jgi:hypothetical protein
MIVVDVGHAHVITFLPLSSAVKGFLFIFVKLTTESKKIELFCTRV